MTHKTTHSIGSEAESIAASFLTSLGYTILEQNYRYDRAEIDIVAIDGKIVVFVEVKMRSTTQFGFPEEFVDGKKIQHLHKASEAWLHERGYLDHFARFDVVSIIKTGNSEPEIKHLIDAFR